MIPMQSGARAALVAAAVIASASSPAQAFAPAPLAAALRRSLACSGVSRVGGSPLALRALVESSAAVEAEVYKFFPPTDLSYRMQVSRTDGYWPYVVKDQEVPLSMTYGEFALPFLRDAIDVALDLSGKPRSEPAVFCDMGSGAGRLVLAASAMHDWQQCKGVELLPGLHELATKTLGGLEGSLGGIPLSPIQLTQGSWNDDHVALGDVDVLFTYSTAFDEELMRSLTESLGSKLKDGAVVITTEYELEREGGGGAFELVRTMDGDNVEVGGTSTAFFYKKSSL